MENYRKRKMNLKKIYAKKLNTTNNILQDMDTFDICRICHTGSSLEQPLCDPCICCGSMAYVHQHCLQEWILYSGKTNCELCQHKFKFVNLHRTKNTLLNALHKLPQVLAAVILEATRIFFYTCLLIFTMAFVPLYSYKLAAFLFTTKSLDLIQHFFQQWQQMSLQNIFHAYITGLVLQTVNLRVTTTLVEAQARTYCLFDTNFYQALIVGNNHRWLNFEIKSFKDLLNNSLALILAETVFQICFLFVPYLLGVNLLIFHQIINKSTPLTPLKFTICLLLGHLIITSWLYVYTNYIIKRSTTNHVKNIKTLALRCLHTLLMPIYCGCLLHCAVAHLYQQAGSDVLQAYVSLEYGTPILHFVYGLTFMTILKMFVYIFYDAERVRTCLLKKTQLLLAQVWLILILVIVMVWLPTLLLNHMFPKLLEFSQQSFCQIAEAIMQVSLLLFTYTTVHNKCWYGVKIKKYLNFLKAKALNWCKQHTASMPVSCTIAYNCCHGYFYFYKGGIICQKTQLYNFQRLCIACILSLTGLCLFATTTILYNVGIARLLQRCLYANCSPLIWNTVLVYFMCLPTILLRCMLQQLNFKKTDIFHCMLFVWHCYWLGVVIQAGILQPFGLLEDRTQLSDLDRLHMGLPLALILLPFVRSYIVRNTYLSLGISFMLFYMAYVIKWFLLPRLVTNRKLINHFGKYMHTYVLLGAFIILMLILTVQCTYNRIAKLMLHMVKMHRILLNYEGRQKPTTN